MIEKLQGQTVWTTVVGSYKEHVHPTSKFLLHLELSFRLGVVTFVSVSMLEKKVSGFTVKKYSEVLVCEELYTEFVNYHCVSFWHVFLLSGLCTN